MDLNLRVKYGITVIAIKRNNELIHSPGAKTIFEDKDTAVIVGTRKGLKGFGDKA
jgi:trk system potassium uptake protein TrkA